MQPSTSKGLFNGWMVNPAALAKDLLIIDLVHPLSICATAGTGFVAPLLYSWTKIWKAFGFRSLIILLILFLVCLLVMVFDVS